MANLRLNLDPRPLETGADRAERSLEGVKTSAFRAESAVERLGRGVRRGSRRLSEGTSVNRNFGRSVQNVSFQIGDFAAQVGAGTAASVALGQQMPQLLGGFGVLGAAMGAVVAIAVPLSNVLFKMTAGAIDLSAAFPILAGSFSGVSSIAETFDKVVGFAVENLERVVFIAGTAAALFAGKFVVGLVAARVATMSLAGALTFLRGALIRTGIGALVVGAGELVYQFSRLVRGAGGFGEAMAILKDVASEAFGRIDDIMEGLKHTFASAAAYLKSVFLDAIHSVLSGFMELTNQIADGMNALFNTNIFSGAKLGLVVKDLDLAAREALGRSESSSATASSAFDRATAPLESLGRLKDTLSKVDAEYKKVADSSDKAGKKGKGAADKAAKAAKKAADAAKKLAEETGKVWEQFKQAGGSAIDRLIDGTATLKDALIDVIKELGKAILKKNLLSKIQGTTASDSVGTMLFKGLFSGFFDGGGTIGMGQYGVVGENGPEIVRSTSSGAVVTSRADTARMMGGNQNVNVQVGVSVDDAGSLRAYVQNVSTSAARGAAGAAVQQVKGNFKNWQNQLETDGALA
ncbi:hypothetical protein BV394_01945 [Brevirhabdus pacifica]|uniref:Uncharacterized protein n=1 Tax=Brevirhabdus pacifica TaxID=1267768 RepID=A0A1U7DFH5_9RHOB|nr:hypothetical protein [Brevirhabdus pacifica]APX88643.1 hypothetical protein BV394_01945 [Brevirhabdus pacifica]OWU79917.1 hypothetical protein ATO5_02635 [Loktanella sp. 22II-4b]PJJ86857.1 hypothetical protein CLV77_1417 [Brevirhabdus pacifica]